MGSGERKSADNALDKQSDIATTQADISGQVANQSMPWTTLAGNYYQDILKGGDSLTKAVSPQINSATSQYGVARSKAKEQPLGGSRDRALREINLGEASSKSNIYSGGVSDAISNLASMGQTGTSTALGGYGSASSTLGNVASQYGQAAQGKSSSMGSLAGAGGGIAAAAIAA
jgi:hypothetical protein